MSLGFGAISEAPLSTLPAGTDVTVTPGIDTLVLTGFAPTVTAEQNVTVSPANDTLVLTGLAPTVTATRSQTVTPGVGSLVITGYEPEVSDGVPDAGGADSAGIKSNKKKPKRRIILNPEDLKAPKSVEEQVSEFLEARNKPAPKPKPKPKKPAKSEPLILTDEEKEAMAYWAEQQAIDDEEDDIIMLLMAA